MLFVNFLLIFIYLLVVCSLFSIKVVLLEVFSYFLLKVVPLLFEYINDLLNGLSLKRKKYERLWTVKSPSDEVWIISILSLPTWIMVLYFRIIFHITFHSLLSWSWVQAAPVMLPIYKYHYMIQIKKKLYLTKCSPNFLLGPPLFLVFITDIFS